MRKSYLILFFFLGITFTASSQITVDTTATALQLAQNLIGGGIVISNVKLSCPSGGSGIFTATNSNLGMSSGIALCSGNASNIIGPNASPSTTTAFLTYGDADLNNMIAPDSTKDACSLEFDAYVSNDTLLFNYVFGSEEYEEFVNSFNDVFGLFVSGPGIVGKVNVAKIPNTTSIVSINNVNCAVNSAYYVCNDDGSVGVNSCTSIQCPASNLTTTVEYDGFTKVLQAKLVVQKCNTYHLKFAVGDANDNAFDSGIFIESSSLTSTGVRITAATNLQSYPNLVEGCLNGNICFTRLKKFQDTLIFKFVIGGTAINGIDYIQIPNSIIFYPNDTTICLNIIPVQDSKKEPIETVTIKIIYPNCGAGVVGDSVGFYLQDTLIIGGIDTALCITDTGLIRLRTDVGSLPVGTILNYNWQPISQIAANGNTGSPLVFANTNTTFTCKVDNIPNCPSSASVAVKFNPLYQLDVVDTIQPCQKIEDQINIKAPIGLQKIKWSSDNSFGKIFDSTKYQLHFIADVNGYIFLTTQKDLCTVKDSVFVKPYPCPGVLLPSAFTPNGDGVNDNFFLVTNKYKKILFFEIYNRWGEKLFSTTDIQSKGWDGTFGGALQPSGVYVVHLKLIKLNDESEEFKGNVTLIK